MHFLVTFMHGMFAWIYAYTCFTIFYKNLTMSILGYMTRHKCQYQLKSGDRTVWGNMFFYKFAANKPISHPIDTYKHFMVSHIDCGGCIFKCFTRSYTGWQSLADVCRGKYSADTGRGHLLHFLLSQKLIMLLTCYDCLTTKLMVFFDLHFSFRSEE